MDSGGMSKSDNAWYSFKHKESDRELLIRTREELAQAKAEIARLRDIIEIIK